MYDNPILPTDKYYDERYIADDYDDTFIDISIQFRWQKMIMYDLFNHVAFRLTWPSVM